MKLENYDNDTAIDIDFETNKIESDKDLEAYKKILGSINDKAPFYKTELLGTTDMSKHQLYYFVLRRNKKPVVVMPFYCRNVLVNEKSTPYRDVISPYGYSGPLYNELEITAQIITKFWKEVDCWYQDKNIVSEFVRFSLNGNHKGYTGELIPSLKNVRGALLNEEQQWTNFKPKVRNNYRKSTQEDIQIEIYKTPISLEVVKDFYDIYIQTMQRNNAHDQYFFYIDYFINFISENPDRAVIAIVYKESIPISTELILNDGNTLYSYLGGTLSEYFYTRPNDYLKIEIMKWARDHGYKYYVLGGGRVDGDGLYKYKKSFFPKDEDIIYYTGRKIVNKKIYDELISKNDITGIQDPDDIRKNHFPLYRHNE